MALTLLLPILALRSCIPASSASLQQLDSRDLLNLDGMQTEIVSTASCWSRQRRALPPLSPGWIGQSKFTLAGTSGVSAMQVILFAFPLFWLGTESVYARSQ